MYSLAEEIFVGIFDKIKSSFGTGKLKQEQIEALRRLIWDAVRDGQITESELYQMNTFFYDSELAAEDFQKLKSEIFVQHDSGQPCKSAI
jgi:hypothetical protein